MYMDRLNTSFLETDLDSDGCQCRRLEPDDEDALDDEQRERRLAWLATAEEQHNLYEELQLHQVHQINDFWFWLQHGFLPYVWREESQKVMPEDRTPDMIPGRIARWNQVIGGIRLVQLRSSSMPCIIPREIKDWYIEDCHPSGFPQLEAYGPGLENDVPGFFPRRGMPGRFERSFGINKPLNAVLLEVEHSLRRYMWCDLNTVDITIQAALVNSEAGVVSIMRIRFDVDRAGDITTEVDVRSVSAEMYPTVWKAIPDILFFSLLVAMVIRRRRSRIGKFHLCSLEELLMLVTVIVGFGIGLFFVFVWRWNLELAQQIAELPDAPSEVTLVAPQENVPLHADKQYNDAWGKVIDNVDDLMTMKMYHRLSMFWYTLVITANWYGAVEGQPRLSLLVTALKKACMDVLHFFVIFIIAFFNFALGGYLLFGSYIKGWSTFQRCISSCFTALFGAGDFAEMYKMSPYLTLVWYWLFMVLMALILFNLILAIVIDTYKTMRYEFGPSVSIFQQMKMLGFAFFRPRVITWCINKWRKSRKKYELSDQLDLLSGKKLRAVTVAVQDKVQDKIEMENMRKSKDETKIIVPTTLFELRVFNQKARSEAELRGKALKAVTGEDLMELHFEGLEDLDEDDKQALCDACMDQARDHFDAPTEPHDIRLKLLRTWVHRANAKIVLLAERCSNLDKRIRNLIESCDDESLGLEKKFQTLHQRLEMCVLCFRALVDNKAKDAVNASDGLSPKERQRTRDRSPERQRTGNLSPDSPASPKALGNVPDSPTRLPRP